MYTRADLAAHKLGLSMGVSGLGCTRQQRQRNLGRRAGAIVEALDGTGGRSERVEAKDTVSEKERKKLWKPFLGMFAAPWVGE